MQSNLLSAFTIREVTFRNRAFVTGHRTNMAAGGIPSPQMIAYHEARARGGAALIVTEVAHIHTSATIDARALSLCSDEAVPGFARLADAVHRHDCRIIGQVYYPGRSGGRSSDGSAPALFAPSAIPDERAHVMPAVMPESLIHEIEHGFAEGAGRLIEAGFDGVEVFGAHGVLISQFLSAQTNRRTDDYGGDLDGRMLFLRNVLRLIRERIGPEPLLGLRLSYDECVRAGLTSEESEAVFARLDKEGLLDYFNVTMGGMASPGASRHIVPPMWYENGYTAGQVKAVRDLVSRPVFLSGRINQPDQADNVLAEGVCDMVAMTRAHICDPEVVGKTARGQTDDIRACIACNQACIGHMHNGFSVSCIQFPESGRELEYSAYPPATERRKVIVAGGGPAGMKAAIIAAKRGHDVELHEQSGQLGGQALLAQMLPGRAEFGGLVTNLRRELELAGVKVSLRSSVTLERVKAWQGDRVIIATGAASYLPDIEGADEAHLVDAWSVIRDEANVGKNVVVVDWRGDWVGMGVAEKLARAGCRVTLAVNAPMAGSALQMYVRDHWAGILHELEVTIVTYASLFGVDESNVYFEHMTSETPIVLSDIDTTVLALGHVQQTGLYDALVAQGWADRVQRIGDCLSPRTAEEAVLEGLKAGCLV